MVGWHHQLNGHGFGWTLGVGDGQGGLTCCDSWGCKESDTTERLNCTDVVARVSTACIHFFSLLHSFSFYGPYFSSTWMGFWFALKILTIAGKTTITFESKSFSVSTLWFLLRKYVGMKCLSSVEGTCLIMLKAVKLFSNVVVPL